MKAFKASLILEAKRLTARLGIITSQSKYVPTDAGRTEGFRGVVAVSQGVLLDVTEGRVLFHGVAPKTRREER